MTAIIGMKQKNRIIIGADSISTIVNDAEDYLDNEYHSKVQRINGSPSCLIACAGRFSSITTIQNIKNLLDKKDDVSFSYMVKNVVPKIFKECKTRNLLINKDDYSKLDVSIIIATKKHLYEITSIGAVIEIKNVICIGAGKNQLCNSYINLKDSKKDIKEIVISCLKETCEMAQGIGYPLLIAENDSNKEMEIINR